MTGTASFTDDHTMKIMETGEVFSGDKFILSTGSLPVRLSIEGSGTLPLLTKDNLLNLIPCPIVNLWGDFWCSSSRPPCYRTDCRSRVGHRDGSYSGGVDPYHLCSSHSLGGNGRGRHIVERKCHSSFLTGVSGKPHNSLFGNLQDNIGFV
jgi:hypothetical protein